MQHKVVHDNIFFKGCIGDTIVDKSARNSKLSNIYALHIVKIDMNDTNDSIITYL